MRSRDPCPCGLGPSYGACCGRYLEGEPLPTAEATMRSRYTAWVVGDLGHLLRTWHPRTRPADLRPAAVRWTGLRVLAVRDGGPHDETGVVEFEARLEDGGREQRLHEVSRFARRGTRWVYLDAVPEAEA